MGSLVGTMVAGAIGIVSQRLLWSPLQDAALGAALGAGVLLSIQAILASLTRSFAWAATRRGLQRTSAWLRGRRAWVVAWPLGLVVVLLGPRVGDGTVVPGLAGVLAALAITAASTGALLGAALRRHTRPVVALLLLTTLVLDTAVALALLHPGDPSRLVPPLSPAAVEPLALADPGRAGPYRVSTLTYGSGTHGLPAEFGEAAELATTSVDLTPVVPGYNGIFDRYVRWRYTGFDAVPVNGRVWTPQGPGPFPLALIVHGNHTQGDDSTPGYGYLAHHLASHGIIAVSVDQNVLNGNLLGDGGGGEMPARAWLLLEHLRWWHRWNGEPDNPFADRVDLGRVALVGHSRGGEAAARAALLRRQVHPPVDRLGLPVGSDVDIRAVVGLAPSDGMWLPSGRPQPLEDTSYLLVQGAYDADLPPLLGLDQYGRVSFPTDPDAFKAIAYLHRADHGQFNTGWGRGDIGPTDTLLLSRAPLLSGDEQQRAARTLVTAFLAAVLHDADGYRAVFARPDAARRWLPDDVVVTAYQDGTLRPLLTGDTPLRPPSFVAEDVTLARRTPRNRDGGPTTDRAVTLRWEDGTTPSVTIDLPEAAVGRRPGPADAITFRYGAVEDVLDAPGDVQVTVTTTDGVSATVPISEVTSIRAPLPARLLRAPWLNRVLGAEVPHTVADANVVLQTYDLPLSLFSAVEPDLQLEHLALLTLTFDGRTSQRVYLDDLGIRRRTPAEVAATDGATTGRDDGV